MSSSDDANLIDPDVPWTVDFLDGTRRRLEQGCECRSASVRFTTDGITCCACGTDWATLTECTEGDEDA
jgi:hypothetical protein